MDPLDPLTEIVKSGQAFSTTIILERLLWLMIGFSFIGAISTSIINGIKKNNLFGNKSFLPDLKDIKQKSKIIKKNKSEEL